MHVRFRWRGNILADGTTSDHGQQGCWQVLGILHAKEGGSAPCNEGSFTMSQNL
jgi:hypothetical protein